MRATRNSIQSTNKYTHNYTNKFTGVFLYIICNRNVLVLGEFIKIQLTIYKNTAHNLGWVSQFLAFLQK
jgi:hypothetical protein